MSPGALNYYAIAAAAASSIVIGFIWYGPLFGTAWMKEMGVAPDFKPDPSLMQRSLLLMTVGAVLTALALASALHIAGSRAPAALQGLATALGAWAGFYVPMLLGGVAWENRSWKWFRINAGYHLMALLAAAMILAYWR